MMYCEEYKNWVDSTVDATFSIKETSANMKPGDTNDNVRCDGIGFIGLYKQDDGQLMFKFPNNSELGYELMWYPGVFKKYNP
jgi:hypothetical protein